MEVPTLTLKSKQIIENILEKAANNIEFRNALLSNPSAALVNTGLDEEEIKLLSDLKRVKMEEWGVDIRKYRAFLRDNGNKVDVGGGK